jgi:hypothetical protein
LLPVTLSADTEAPDAAADVQTCSAGAIHIEFPGRAMISIESGGHLALLGCVFGEFAQVIYLPAGTRIWLAASVTEMRRGFDGLSAQVQAVLQQQQFSGHVFLFRGAERRYGEVPLV